MDGKCKHCPLVVGDIDDSCAGFQCPNCGKYTSREDLLASVPARQISLKARAIGISKMIADKFPCVLQQSVDVFGGRYGGGPEPEFTHGQHEFIDGKCRRCGIDAPNVEDAPPKPTPTHKRAKTATGPEPDSTNQ